MTTKELPEFVALVKTVAKLRAPDGCPWDREQTHISLAPHLLEECYEALEALDKQDAAKLCVELGDVLMQVVLHAQIASENGEFTIQDVVRGINTKLIHRHPHVFGQTKVKDSQEVLHNWETLKQQEFPEGDSLLGSLPQNMPALAYAQSIQRRAASVGFDWPNIEDIMEKLVEEVGELREAGSIEEKRHEFGDLLFTLVNIARRLDIDTETALRQANKRFYQRFSHMEELCHQRGVSLNKMSLAEQDVLWEEAKRALKSESGSG